MMNMEKSEIKIEEGKTEGERRGRERETKKRKRRKKGETERQREGETETEQMRHGPQTLRILRKPLNTLQHVHVHRFQHSETIGERKQTKGSATLERARRTFLHVSLTIVPVGATKETWKALEWKKSRKRQRSTHMQRGNWCSMQRASRKWHPD